MQLIDSTDEWRVVTPEDVMSDYDNDLSCVEESIFYPVEQRLQIVPTKTAAIFTLAQLEQWSREFCAVRCADEHPDDVRLRQLYVSDFLAWLQNKTKETNDGEK